MKAWIIAAAAAVLGVAGGVAAALYEMGPAAGAVGLPSADGPAPQAVLDATEFDFGTAPHDGKGEHTFIVRNAGDAPLRLEEVHSTCQCTIGKFSRQEVPPGGETPILVTWSAAERPGPFRQTVTIETNDPLKPRINLTITGEVLVICRVTPAFIVFSIASPASRHKAQALIHAFGQEDIKVLGHEFLEAATAGHFEVSIQPLTPEELTASGARGGVKVEITLKPGLPSGPIRQTIRLRTNLKQQEMVDIPIEGDVKGDILVSAPPAVWNPEKRTLTLGRAGVIESQAGAKAEVKLLVFGAGHEQVNFRVASVEPSVLEVEVGTPSHLQNQTIVPLRVAIPPGTPPMSHVGSQRGPLGSITLETGRPGDTGFTLNVRFAVKD